ncbi:hypothetical protein J7M22_14975 [Candidatus Poribacteria bacterium]|nr:hypothetical protein [Candidatus Poribacteria bacterium]
MLELTKQRLKPTYDDAGVYLKVVELLSKGDVVKAMMELFIRDAASLWRNDTSKLRMIKLLNVMEAAGILLKNKLIHEDLMFGSIPVHHLWDKARPIVEEIRRQTGISSLYSSFEEMAESARRWVEDGDAR